MSTVTMVETVETAVVVEMTIEEATRRDARLVSAFNAGEMALSEIADAIVDAQESWTLIKDANGQPFVSWADYLTSRQTGHVLLPKVLRADIVKLLVKSGASVRAVSDITGTSVGTAHSEVTTAKRELAAETVAETGTETGTETVAETVTGTDTGTKRGARPVKGVTLSKEQLAAKAVKSALAALDKVAEQITEVSDEDLSIIRTKMVGSSKQIAAVQKARAELKASENPGTPTPNTARRVSQGNNPVTGRTAQAS